MGKLQFAATSLVTALPAGMLATVIVMHGFLKHVSDMGTVLMVFSGLMLLASVFLLLMPAGILIWGGPRKVKAAAKPAKDQAGEDASAAVSADEISEGDVDVLETSGEAQIVDSDADAVALDDDDIEATTAFTTPASGTDLGEDADEVVDIEDLDDFATMEEISDEVILEDDEDDTPKKKRR